MGRFSPQVPCWGHGRGTDTATSRARQPSHSGIRTWAQLRPKHCNLALSEQRGADHSLPSAASTSQTNKNKEQGHCRRSARCCGAKTRQPSPLNATATHSQETGFPQRGSSYPAGRTARGRAAPLRHKAGGPGPGDLTHRERVRERLRFTDLFTLGVFWVSLRSESPAPSSAVSVSLRITP